MYMTGVQNSFVCEQKQRRYFLLLIVLHSSYVGVVRGYSWEVVLCEWNPTYVVLMSADAENLFKFKCSNIERRNPQVILITRNLEMPQYIAILKTGCFPPPYEVYA